MRIKSFGFVIAVAAIVFFSHCKPKQAAVQTVTQPVEKKDTTIADVQPAKPVEPVNAEYTISFFMPFHFNENLSPPENDLVEQEILAASLPSIQFYEGAKMAIDSFRNEHLKVSLKIFDSGDSSKLDNYINGFRIYNTDLLFLNAPASNLPSILKNAEKNKTNLVNIQSASTRGRNLMSCLPNNQTMIREMAAYIAGNYKSERVIVVYRDTKKEKELGEWFAGSIDSNRSLSPTKEELCIRVNYSSSGAEGLIKKLDKSRLNLVVIASSDEAFVSPLINTLVENGEVYRLQACGLPTWENFETVNIAALEKLQTIIFSSGYINYDDTELKQFRREFISRYSTDPLLQAYHGFYLMKCFISSMNTEQKNWKDFKLSNMNFNPSLFDFSKSNNDNGFENTRISVLKFSDYKLQPQTQ